LGKKKKEKRKKENKKEVTSVLGRKPASLVTSLCGWTKIWILARWVAQSRNDDNFGSPWQFLGDPFPNPKYR
jgi:hypothetical protein